MSTTIGTNVVADGEKELQFLKKIFDIFEKKWLESKDKYKIRSAKLMAEYFEHGNIADFTMLRKDIAEEFVQQLEKADIPCIEMRTENGDVAVCMRKSDNVRTEEILKQIQMLDPDYFAQQTIEDLLDIEKRSGNEKVTVIECNNKEDFLSAKQALHYSGIVCAAEDFNTEPYKARIVIRSKELYSGKNNDFAATRLLLTLNGSVKSKTLIDKGGKGLNDYKRAINKHTSDLNKELSKRIKSDEEAYLMPINQNENFYVKYKNGILSVMERDADTKVWKATKTHDIRKVIENGKDVGNVVHSFLSNSVRDMSIEMAVVSSESLAQNSQKLDKTELREKAYKDKYMLRLPEKLRYYPNPKEYITDENRISIINTAIEQFKKDVLPTISKVAHQRAKASRRFNGFSPMEQHISIVNEMTVLLKSKDSLELQSWIDKTKQALQEYDIDVDEWVNEMAENLSDNERGGDGTYDFYEQSLKKLQAEREKDKKRENQDKEIHEAKKMEEEAIYTREI